MNRARIRRPAMTAALAVAAVATLIVAAGCRPQPTALSPAPTASDPVASSPSGTPGAAATTGAPGTGPSTAPPSPTAPSPTASSPSRPPSTPAASGPLRIGDSGPAVLRLQQRLTALGYWVGTLDGKFGSVTQQGVYALQKAAKLSPTGTVTAATQRALDAGTMPHARSTTGRIIEVNLSSDLLMFVTNGHVQYTLNTSTGGGYVYYDQGERDVATTPKGHFTTYRVIDGPHESSLGLLIRPRYFTGGYAIHGDSSVPAHPASHGCVRVSNSAIDWIWSKNLDPIGTTVWIY